MNNTLHSARIAALTLAVASATAAGQMPSAPVLQNVWASPGLVGAFNLGGGSDGSVYAAAGSWAPGSGRFQLSGGVGAQVRADAGSRFAYGARLAIPFTSAASSFGFAAFGGVGGASGSGSTGTTVDADTTSNVLQIPAGVAVGWRRAIGTRGISLYASPSYVWLSGSGKTTGLVRGAVAADIGVTSSIGLTGGVEFGQTRARSQGGPSGTLYGIGVSYAFGRR